MCWIDSAMFSHLSESGVYSGSGRGKRRSRSRWGRDIGDLLTEDADSTCLSPALSEPIAT